MDFCKKQPELFKVITWKTFVINLIMGLKYTEIQF